MPDGPGHKLDEKALRHEILLWSRIAGVRLTGGERRDLAEWLDRAASSGEQEAPPERDERRWTIYVCPECGLVAPPFMARDGGFQCMSEHEPVECEYVEVVPVSPREARQGEGT